MSIKAGTFLHDVHGFVIDRIQTGGVSALNIPQTKVYELGNYQTVGNVYDIPDLTFDIDSIDVSTEVEALLHGKDPTTIVSGNSFDFSTTYPLDVISPFKAGNGAFNIVKGIAVPYLTLDTVDYTFGVKADATEKFSLKGDSVYYIPGSPYYQQFNLVATGPYNFSHTALPYVESGNTFHALSACVKNLSTGAFKRLFFTTGTDALGYTDTTGGISTITNWASAGYTTLHVTYGSTVAATYAQATNAPVTGTKPASVRSKDVLLYVGTAGTTSNLTKWSGVQSFNLSRKVNLQSDEEFGNTKYVATDYDTADVTGSITVRAADAAALWTLIEQVSNTLSSEISGPLSRVPLEILVQVRNPDTGAILKSWGVPDARFIIPASSGKVQTKLDSVFPFTSDAGLMTVYQGTP